MSQQGTPNNPATIPPGNAPAPSQAAATTAAATPISRFGINARSRAEALSMGTTVSRQDRSTLRPEEKRKFHASATAKLDPLFSMSPDTIDINSGSFLESNHDFFLQLSKLKQHLTSYCLVDVFNLVTVFNPTSGAPDDSDPTTLIDMLDNYLEITEDQVAASNQGYRFWGDDVSLENLNWTQDLLLNSCDPTLYEEVASKLYAADEASRGGPLVLHYIIQLTVKTTDRTARAIVNKLQEFKLSKIPGENVNTAAAIIRSAVLRLRSAKKLPDDIHHIVFDIFLSCSVYTFKNHFQTLETMGSPKVTTWESILKEGELLYERLEYEGLWSTRYKKGSNFKATANPPATPAANFQKDNKSSEKRTHDRKGNPIDRTPPAKGAPTERKKGDRTEHWCGHDRCGRWGSHPTSGHDDWFAKTQKNKSKNKTRRNTTKSRNAPPTEYDMSNMNPPAAQPKQQQPRLRFAAATVASQANF
jgi:hypothetical protein